MRKRSVKQRPVPTPSSVGPLARTFLLASIAVVGAAYGVVRHYTTTRPPMVAPRPAPTEIPVELE